MPYEGVQGSEESPFLLPDKKTDLPPKAPFLRMGNRRRKIR